MSSATPHRSIEEMKRQLREKRSSAPPTCLSPTQKGIFRGYILETEFDTEDVERDGGGLSKIREGLPKIGGGRSRAKSVGSTLRKKESDIMLLSTPNGAEPGCFAFGNKIVFFSGETVLEATDSGVVRTSVLYDDPLHDKEAAFSLESKSNDTNVYKMVNDNSYCVCMTNKENDPPQLVSLSVDDTNNPCVMQFITVYQLNTPSSENDIAIFFSYAKSEKLYNCYLVPHSSSSEDPCKVSLKEVDITHMNDDMQKNEHHKYLNFTLKNPVSKDHTDAAEHHVLTVADNGAASLTQSLESSGGSTDSGQGSSIKEQNGQEGGDESETSSLEQSK